MNIKIAVLIVLSLSSGIAIPAKSQISPSEISFVRQGVRRFIMDDSHQIPLAALKPGEIIGISAMYPVTHYSGVQARVEVTGRQLAIRSAAESETAIWFGGFNPFATYTMDLASSEGEGEIGFEFSDAQQNERLLFTVTYQDKRITDVHQKLIRGSGVVLNESIAIVKELNVASQGRLILQMLGSGMTMYMQNEGLPLPIGQSDFSQHVDLRKKKYLDIFQSSLYISVKNGQVSLNGVASALSSGMGLADIRAITYEDGSIFLDRGRLWYTMTIRGRGLPQQVQGVFSMDPTAFDVRFEGIILFDRRDGLLRNEVASHIFYDRTDKVWRGLTTGFSAYAIPGEKKQLMAVTSKKDPRFGFSIMQASPFGMVGDIEDPHILYDAEAGKWRILTCENRDGYKAVMLESDTWNKGYKRIAGPVMHNSTGTSMQLIGGKRYCFSGSQDRRIYLYTYPDLKDAGYLKMDLPPWDKESGTRVWPNVVELPEGYPFRFIALMMDRFNYPGLQGPNWTYGALYLYHGYLPSNE